MPDCSATKKLLLIAILTAVVVVFLFELNGTRRPLDHIAYSEMLARQRSASIPSTLEIRTAIDALTHQVEKFQELEDRLQAMTIDLQKTADELATYKVKAEHQDKLENLEDVTQSLRIENEPEVNELFTWFTDRQKGPGAHKWSTYLDAYHRHFNRFRTQAKITMVEVGVQSGGSIEMWRSYFGADKLNYIGIDINPECKQFEKDGVRIVIGNQGDPAFWEQFKKEIPDELDIFVDDGGHTMNQQIVTFDKMFWGVRDGGIYLCEDLHTSYWQEYEGGYLNNNSMIEKSKTLIDTINAWHSKEAGLQVNSLTRNIRGLHFYDSMIFIDKRATEPMERMKSGDYWIDV
ncbi:hypothetical protein VYU27_008298 [Nannochloropsis oceanica]